MKLLSFIYSKKEDKYKTEVKILGFGIKIEKADSDLSFEQLIGLKAYLVYQGKRITFLSPF